MFNLKNSKGEIVVSLIWNEIVCILINSNRDYMESADKLQIITKEKSYYGCSLEQID